MANAVFRSIERLFITLIFWLWSFNLIIKLFRIHAPQSTILVHTRVVLTTFVCEFQIFLLAE